MTEAKARVSLGAGPRVIPSLRDGMTQRQVWQARRAVCALLEGLLQAPGPLVLDESLADRIMAMLTGQVRTSRMPAAPTSTLWWSARRQVCDVVASYILLFPGSVTIPVEVANELRAVLEKAGA